MIAALPQDPTLGGVESGGVTDSDAPCAPSAWHAPVHEIYQALQERLPPTEANLCGLCRACCTRTGVTFQTVLDVEISAMAEVLGEEAASRFQAYARRDPAEGGQPGEEDCPLYDPLTRGCSVHPHRPFSCRLFGHYRVTGTALPPECVFQGREKEFDAPRYLEAVPLARELRDLDRRHGAFHRPTPSHMQKTPTHVPPELLEKARAFMNPDDPLDMAVLAHIEGRLEDALALFDVALAATPRSAWAWFQQGTLLDELKRPQQAAASYRRALAIEEDNPLFWLHLAFNLLEAGEVAEARDAFAATVRLNPDDAVACGLLGSLLWGEGRAAEALEPLRHAAEMDPDNVWFRVRLAEVLCVLGRPAEAEPHMAVAAAHPQAAGHVAALRTAFGLT